MSGFSASRLQRLKVAEAFCVVCGSPDPDPAHVCPRSLGGCDDPLCVVGLCRLHHRAYDEGELDLLPYLEPAYRPELAHALMHVGLVGLQRRVSNVRPRAIRHDEAWGAA